MQRCEQRLSRPQFQLGYNRAQHFCRAAPDEKIDQDALIYLAHTADPYWIRSQPGCDLGGAFARQY